MDVNDKHSDGNTPLHRACWGREQRHTDTVLAMLELGADYKSGDGKGGVSCLLHRGSIFALVLLILALDPPLASNIRIRCCPAYPFLPPRLRALSRPQRLRMTCNPPGSKDIITAFVEKQKKAEKNKNKSEL